MVEAESMSTDSVRKECSFASFCHIDNCLDSRDDSLFAGIRYEKGKLAVYFPRGLATNLMSYLKTGEACVDKFVESALHEAFFLLMGVLSDKSLMDEVASREPDFKAHQDFPIRAYMDVLQYFMDFGYFEETEAEYRKSTGGKINWSRTIRTIDPKLVKSEEGCFGVVYLDTITRKVNYRDDSLISLIHKFCVRDAVSKIGPLFGFLKDDVEDPEIAFDYGLFSEVLQNKIAGTFNEKHLELFYAMEQIVDYLAGRRVTGSELADDFVYGVNTFAPVWEAMVDRIFGKLPAGVSRDKFNPHCNWDLASGLPFKENPNYAMRPDTIMIVDSRLRENDECKREVFVLDSKYYKYGMTRNPMDLPSSGSICKQIAYAEYVETHLKEIPAFAGMTSGDIYNAFIMPFCAEGEMDSIASLQSDNLPYKMRFIGHCSGDWKNPKARPYHKIAGILLDMKSVMRNYANNPAAQDELAQLIHS